MTIPPDNSEKISPNQPLTPGGPTAPGTPQKGDFESHMQNAPSGQAPSQPQGLSPGQVPQGPATPQGSSPSLDSVTSQVTTAQDSIGNLQNKLNTNNLKLTRSQQHLLRNKLTDASTHLRAANSKMGLDPPAMPEPKGSGPIAKFLSYVADGENQLKAAKQQLSDLKNSGDSLRPSDMILIQIKLNKAQQEIEYSSVLLSKVITSLTQILNTQL